MKVLFLKSAILKRGGLEKYTLRLAAGFKEQGHDVTILTTDYKEGALPYNVIDLGKKLSFSLLELLRFDLAARKVIKKLSPDIVFGMERHFCLQTHYRAGNGCHAAYLDRRKKGESWLKGVSFSLNPLHKLILSMEKKTFESPQLKRLYVNSHMVEREILAYYPKVDPKKIMVVHNGVEWHEFEKPFEEGLKSKGAIMHSLGLNPGAYQFLFVGNEYGRKGLHQLLEALSHLKNKNFELTVIGKERNPEPYKLHAKALRLEKQVHFIGQVSEMKTYYTASDALVIPSLYDPFANVTVEALAMGLKVVSSNANGGSEVITSELGYVYRTPEELLEALEAVMKQPKTPASAKAIRQAVAHLDFSNQIQKIVSNT